jgi:hypothetical protein
VKMTPEVFWRIQGAMGFISRSIRVMCLMMLSKDRFYILNWGGFSEVVLLFAEDWEWGVLRTSG